MHLAAALVSLLFGLMIPSMLNGQTFTNNLVGIGFTIAAIALAHGPARDTLSSKASRLLGRAVLIVSVLLTVLLVAQLRTAYRFQAEFNRRARALRQLKQNEKSGFDPHGDSGSPSLSMTPSRPVSRVGTEIWNKPTARPTRRAGSAARRLRPITSHPIRLTPASVMVSRGSASPD
jgi:hypothetical protein